MSRPEPVSRMDAAVAPLATVCVSHMAASTRSEVFISRMVYSTADVEITSPTAVTDGSGGGGG